MAPRLVYRNSDIPVEIGDIVMIHRRFRKSMRGIVISVYDPSAAIEVKGSNEYGVSVDCLDKRGRTYWFPGQPSDVLEFVERS